MSSYLKQLCVPIIAIALLGLPGCGSSSGSCHNCSPPPPVSSSFLYATAPNDLSSFSLGSSGAPTSLASQPGPNQTEGIVADPSGKFLYVSDFLNGAIDAFSITASNGALTQVAGSPFSAGSAPGTGGIAVDPATKFLYATLLNSSAVAGYTINSTTGALTPIAGSPFPAGNSPIQAIVDPTGNFLYVSNVNDSMGTISAYSIDPASGALTSIAGSPFPTQANFPGPAGFAFGAGGKFLYVGMAGTANANNVITGFAVDSTTGALTQLAGSPFATGKDPGRIATDLSGKFLFSGNVQDNTVSAFTIDSSSGGLTPTAGSPFAPGGSPSALAVDKAGAFLYVAMEQPLMAGTSGLAVFRINGTTGSLSPIAGSPFDAGQAFNGVAIAKP